MIVVASRRRKLERIQDEYPNATVVDVTSKADQPWVRFSPFYPHGDIPVPFSEGVTSQSVEGIWQALKVFATADIDLSKLENSKMKGLKRTVRKYGVVKGHRKGIAGTELLDYVTARKLIYLPSYKFVLESKLKAELSRIKTIADNQGLVLLDYEINVDVNNTAKPLSHAGLIKAYIEDRYGKY